MSKSSAIGLAALLGAENPLGFALLGDIVANWSDQLEVVEFQASGTFDPADYGNFLGLFVDCWGGGASGVYILQPTVQFRAGGGSGGCHESKLLLKSDITAPVPVTVGSGGIPSSASYANKGYSGGNSSFGDYVLAEGGTGLDLLNFNGRTLNIKSLLRKNAPPNVLKYMIGSSSNGVSNIGVSDLVQGWSKVFGDDGGYGGYTVSSGTGISQAINNPCDSEYGGASGGDGYDWNGDKSNAVLPSGISSHAGNGGFGRYLSSITQEMHAGDGEAPAGGGGAVYLRSSNPPAFPAYSGAGGPGLVRVTVIHG